MMNEQIVFIEHQHKILISYISSYYDYLFTYNNKEMWVIILIRWLFLENPPDERNNSHPHRIKSNTVNVDGFHPGDLVELNNHYNLMF